MIAESVRLHRRSRRAARRRNPRRGEGSNTLRMKPHEAKMTRNYAYCRWLLDQVMQQCEDANVRPGSALGCWHNRGRPSRRLPKLGQVIVDSRWPIRARSVVASVAVVVIAGAAGCGSNKKTSAAAKSGLSDAQAQAFVNRALKDIASDYQVFHSFLIESPQTLKNSDSGLRSVTTSEPVKLGETLVFEFIEQRPRSCRAC